MKPTRIATLVLHAVAVAIAAYVLVRLMIGAGWALPVSQLNLVLTIPAIALINLGLVWPILRYKKALADYLLRVSRKRPRRPDSFYAMRVLLIAKSSAIAGAWFLGWHVGVLIVQLTATNPNALIWREAFGALGSLLLVVAALIAERGCRLPDGDVAADATPLEKQPSGPVSV
ncbi:MAG: hypothetical protein RL672_1408 [Actinomycetota bacterium]